MKLRNIHENEYAGLEDADEFEDNSICWCGNSIPYGGAIDITYCYKCGQSMCWNCQTAYDYDNYICQDCIADEDDAEFAQTLFAHENIRESEYAGLEDADEFEDEDDWSEVYDNEMDDIGNSIVKHLTNMGKVPANFSDGDNLESFGPPVATWVDIPQHVGGFRPDRWGSWSEIYNGFRFEHPISADRQGFVSYSGGVWSFEWDIF